MSVTAEQHASLDRPGPRAYEVITADGFSYVTVDQALAQKYAANSHGIVVPLTPWEKTDAA